MKLQELIIKLQELEKTEPDIAVEVQLADMNANSISTQSVLIIDVARALKAGKVCCMVTIGRLERDVALYQHHLEIRKQPNA